MFGSSFDPRTFTDPRVRYEYADWNPVMHLAPAASPI